MSHSPTIIAIDDDPSYHELYRHMLEPKGFKLLSALKPADGLAMVRKNKPDFIILDVMMPEQSGFRDGYGVLEEIRRDAVTKDIPVLMISALDDDTDTKHGRDMGATDYLPKQQMTSETLLKKIKKFLGNGNGVGKINGGANVPIVK